MGNSGGIGVGVGEGARNEGEEVLVVLVTLFNTW